MPKLIAAMNMTLDGFCDHTVMTADEEIHDHYRDLLNDTDTVIYGRTTYQLMEFWKPFVENPSGEKSMDEFAIAIDNVHKLVFSHTLKEVDWRNTRLATKSIEEEVADLKGSATSNKDIFVSSPSLIVQTANLHLIDEYQIAVHPVIAGNGLPLFKNITDRIDLKLLKTKKFGCGAVIFYYEPVRK